ncbi:MAG: hypothetical protein HY909_22875 [Deltaproteobacteria bacterium]|nr:hypothetical protein [Deltaproteobacteria bacterium]
MEIVLDKRAVKQIRVSAQDAIDEGDTETLREDIMNSFSEDQVEELERRIDTDFYDFLGDALEEWSGEDVDELFDLLEARFSEAEIELKFEAVEAADADDDDDADFDEDEEEELNEDEEEPLDDD